MTHTNISTDIISRRTYNAMPHGRSSAESERARKKLAAQIESFERAGGTVRQIASGVGAEYNGSPRAHNVRAWNEQHPDDTRPVPAAGAQDAVVEQIIKMIGAGYDFDHIAIISKKIKRSETHTKTLYYKALDKIRARKERAK